MAVLTINQYIDTIESFVNNVTSTKNSYYVFYGRPQPWRNSVNAVDETAIPTSNGSVYAYEQSIYNDIVFGKIITSNDIAYMVQRYNWAANTVYDRYDQNDANLYDKEFYVVNDTYQVFKCIDNNNNANSTIKPTLASTTGVFATSDGYVWKYMYTISNNANTKFTTIDYIPVEANNEVANNATAGSIDFIKTISGGNNYQAYHTGYLQSFANSYQVQIGNTASPTNDRYTNSAIYLRSGFGAGQIRDIRRYSGLSRTVIVSEPFSTETVINVANVQGSIITGLQAYQRIDTLSLLYPKGFFNVGDSVIQSDQGAVGTILTANGNSLRVIKTSANDFIVSLPAFNATQSGVLKSGNVNITTKIVQVVDVITPGSGYNANAAVTITNAVGDTTGASAAANAQSNSSGRITKINVTANGTNYTLAPVVNVAAPSPIFFNANSAIEVSNNFINLGSNGAFFANGDYVRYTANTGNTALANLVSGNSYYVIAANNTGLKLSTSNTGNAIVLAKGLTQTGHSFTGQTATVSTTLSVYVTANGSTAFTTDYTAGDYIRVGSNANTNIRRITAVNSSIITVSQPFTSNVIANVHYSTPAAIEVVSAAIRNANGIISNTNLTGVTLQFVNSSITSLLYTVGERVDMVGIDNVVQGANGIVSYSNTSTIILTNVTGSFLTGTNNFIRGVSSLQKSNISSIASYPTITISDPQGYFLAGQQVFIRTIPDLTEIANATILSSFQTPNELTEYIISPKVTITGDGANALAYSIVNTAALSSNNVTSIVVLNPGSGYTSANVTLTANALFGNGATAAPIIAPLTGHGSDVYKELGARYAGISVTLDSAENEDYKFPLYGSYRRVGIIENPLYDNVVITLDTFDRISFNIANRSDAFTVGEYCIQSGSNSAGVVVFSNTTYVELKGVRGTFIANTANDHIRGLSSLSTANVKIANTRYFQLLSNVEIVSELTSNATARITELISNTSLRLTDVLGQFEINDVVYDTAANAYANVVTIKIANNTVDASSNFGKKFLQTCRLTLTSNVGTYSTHERVVQETSNASGIILNANNELDIIFTNSNGSFAAGQTLTDNTSGATAIITYANNTYLRLTSANGIFTGSHRIINNLNIGADIANVYSVLVLYDVNSVNKFQSSTYVISGQTGGAAGRNQLAGTIIYPELVRNSGGVVYVENVAPIARANTTKEKINLVIKF